MNKFNVIFFLILFSGSVFTNAREKETKEERNARFKKASTEAVIINTAAIIFYEKKIYERSR